ncbi:Cytochrome C553 (soluble cytochrome f) [hydrothermal vent metagenome]|uniref:Cytochrome C553 (Soluble cytochrome f) n=1 Tax=hydrothermal vent metagenome TaxID=652676 RepID=A0A3B1E596_9ZZZZ
MKKLLLIALLIASSSVLSANANGKALFGKCVGCHGAKAEKKALGKSAVIKGWSKAKIEKALNGYKNGTYGKAMKGIMKGQVASLNKKQISMLAGYIAKLK